MEAGGGESGVPPSTTGGGASSSNDDDVPKSNKERVGGEDSLTQLYEQRLRRLQDYQSKVHRSRYPILSSCEKLPSPSPNVRRIIQSSPAPQEAHLLSHGEESPEVLGEETLAPPSVIDINNTRDMEDDLTLSTGIASTEPNARVAVLDTSHDQTHLSLSTIARSIESQNECGEAPVSEEAASISSVPIHMEESNASDKLLGTEDISNPQKEDPTPDEVSETDSGYNRNAAPDSKYETYSIFVDHEQDDRGVEIVLYSVARPHMRGFHFAWLAFFVAFFNWFAITPLLSEVASSLSLSRKELWISSTFAVTGSAFTRMLIGPINDIYGARWTMFWTLLVSAIPTLVSGAAIQNAMSLYIVRLLIGVAGSAFVTCQFWTSTMFTAEVAGTANSLAAGWGNLGGGVAQIMMGTLLFPLFKVLYGGEGYSRGTEALDDDMVGSGFDGPADKAWRTIMVFPGLISLGMAVACLMYSDDSPKGNFRKRQVLGLRPVESADYAVRRAAWNRNTWILFLQYGCCFGVEITMTNAAALYFQEEFEQNTETAAAIASIFGWMNIFARGIGGFCSDMSSATNGMRGRLWVQVGLLLVEGALVCLFSTTETMVSSISVMVLFSIFVQAAEGATYAIVPYVDLPVTGSIAGFVGAGGNVGGIIFSIFFLKFDNRTAFLFIGLLVLASTLLTALIVIPGHRSLIHGADAPEVLSRRTIHAERSVPILEIHNLSTREPRLREIEPQVGENDTSKTQQDDSEPILLTTVVGSETDV